MKITVCTFLKQHADLHPSMKRDLMAVWYGFVGPPGQIATFPSLAVHAAEKFF